MTEGAPRARALTDVAKIERWIARCALTDTGCWEWPGALFGGGYGHVRLASRDRPLHRVVYEHLVGPIPEGLDLDHLCRNRACCNPQHLDPVTRSENLRRSPDTGGVRRGSVTEANMFKTHCPQGHPYDEKNTYRSRVGGRKCRACDRERKAQKAAA